MFYLPKPFFFVLSSFLSKICFCSYTVIATWSTETTYKPPTEEIFGNKTFLLLSFKTQEKNSSGFFILIPLYLLSPHPPELACHSPNMSTISSA